MYFFPFCAPSCYISPSKEIIISVDDSERLRHATFGTFVGRLAYLGRPVETIILAFFVPSLLWRCRLLILFNYIEFNLDESFVQNGLKFE